MALHRAQRLGEEIRKEIVDIVQNNVRDPRIGFVSFTDVEVTRDLRQAKVFFSVFGDEEVRQNTFLGLEKAKGYIRSEMASRLKLRYMPELSFNYDDSFNNGEKISRIINQINDEDKQDGK